MSKKCERMGRNYDANFAGETLSFYYADINDTNFIITKNNQLYVIDFQEAGFLPKSFMDFVLHATTEFAYQVAQELSPGTPTPQITQMTGVSNLYQWYHLCRRFMFESMLKP